MDSYKRMALFAEVVNAGSLTAAARQLGLTPSAVSQQLRALEHSLGPALLHRSTRKLTLTEAGARYFDGCAAMVAAARAADQAPARHRDEPEGALPHRSGWAGCWPRRWRRCANITGSA